MMTNWIDFDGSSSRRPVWLAFLLALILLTGLILPGFAQAQNQVEIERVQINIWPEYDQPEVLVIYRIALSAQTSLPAEMSIRIPRAAETPFNVAVEDVDGMLYNLDYTLTPVNEWIVVTFTTPSPGIQVEFYDPAISRSGETRTYEFTWPGDYDVRSMSFLVQEPVNATKLSIRPDIGRGRPGPDGHTVYTTMIGEVEAGQSFSYTIQYDKPDDELVTPPMSVRSADPVSPQTAGRTTMMEVIPWILGSLGVLMIAAGAFWYWRSGRDFPEPPRKRHQPVQVVADAEAGLEDQIYCQQCGKRAARGDAYCRICGAKLHYD